jgi:alpha-glucoside transport system permease protein
MSQQVQDVSPVNPKQLAISFIGLVVVCAVLYFAFIFMRDSGASKLTIAVLALIVGIGGIWGLLASLNYFVDSLPSRVRNRLRPIVFAGPAALILGFYLVYPSIRTIWLSFFDRFQEEFVGLANYIFIFSNPEMLIVVRNTFAWVVLVPAVAVTLGLLVAVMTDRLNPTMEKVTKSLVFLPLAISFVGASVIWRFMYYYQPPGLAQPGLLNAIVQGLGGTPVAWLTVRPWNNLFLIVIMIWLQTGFAMVILSASVKSVPKDLIDAARIDGAGEIRVFLNVTIPYIQQSILTVTTTIMFLVLKIFDIVWVMTSGQYGTGIVATRMYAEAFQFRNIGRGSALAVFLLIIVIPLMIRNVAQMREARR